MKKFILTLTLTFGLTAQALAQTFTAETNRSEVPAGEIFVLILTYQGDRTNDEPDFAPLQKDFTIYSSSVSNSTIINNNSIVNTKQWQLSLISNQTSGIINIPSINMGKLSSNSLTVSINNALPQPATASDTYIDFDPNQPKYSVSTTVDVKEPYVQQQIKYQIIVEDRGRLNISAPLFSENIKNDWHILPLGEPTLQSKTEGSTTIREVVFNYAIFPQKSGILELPVARVDGYYLTQSKQNRLQNGNIFNILIDDIFAQKNPVILNTSSATIEVKPALPNTTWWLPAKKVETFAKWETKSSDFKIGEAITRKIEIDIVGANENQIPELKFAPIDGVKQYPEKPTVSTTVEKGDITTLVELSIVYIPNFTGKLTIPETSIQWFNTQTNRFEIAVIPADEIDILANPNYVSEEPTPAPVQNTTPTTTVETEEPTKLFLPLSIIGAFLAGIIITYLLLGKSKSKTQTQIVPTKKDYKKAVIEAAKNDDFKALRNNLINWSVERFHDAHIHNLDDIRRHTKSKECDEQLDIILSNLYSPEKLKWDNKKFIQTFEKVCNQRVIKQDKSALPKLYKD